MYDINAGNARPEMAEVGKGSNQLADYRPVERAIENKAAIQERAEAAKAKKKEDEQEQIYKALASVDAKAIKPNDIPYFSNAINQLYTDVAKSVKDKGEIPMQDRIGFESRIAQLNFEGAQSNAAKIQTLKNLDVMTTAPQGTYDEEDIQKHAAFLSSPDYQKNWDTGQLAMNKNFDYGKYVKTVLAPEAKSYAQQHSQRGYEKFDINKANEWIDRSLQDEVNFRAASKMMEKEKKAGRLPADYHDVNEFAKKNFAEDLTSDVTPSLREFELYPPGSKELEEKKFNVYQNKTDSGNTEFSYTNAKGRGLTHQGEGGKLYEIKSYEVNPSGQFTNVKGTISYPNTKEINRVLKENKAIEDNPSLTDEEKQALMKPTPPPIIRPIKEGEVAYKTISKAIEDSQAKIEGENILTHYSIAAGRTSKNAAFRPIKGASMSQEAAAPSAGGNNNFRKKYNY